MAALAMQLQTNLSFIYPAMHAGACTDSHSSSARSSCCCTCVSELSAQQELTKAAAMSRIRVGSFRLPTRSDKKDFSGMALNLLGPNAAWRPSRDVPPVLADAKPSLRSVCRASASPRTPPSSSSRAVSLSWWSNKPRQRVSVTYPPTSSFPNLYGRLIGERGEFPRCARENPVLAALCVWDARESSGCRK